MKTEISSNTFRSPFPRQKLNEDVLRMSRPVLLEHENTENECLYFEIHPSLTKSYMGKNPFYFDIKKCKEKAEEVNKKRILSSRRPDDKNKRPNSSSITITNKKVNRQSSIFLKANYSHCVVDNKKLQTLLKTDKNVLIDKPIIKVLNKNKIKSNSREKIQTDLNPCPENNKLTTKELLNLIYPKTSNKVHQNFGVVPE